MATVNLGRIKPVFRGAYAGGTAYVVDDIVTSGDETFICIQASTGNATSNASYWTKLAAKGTNGTNGTDVGATLTTQGDILIRDGSGLARLGYGTAGQVLKTGGSGANPSWGNAGGGLKQVKFHQSGTTQYSTGSASFGDVGADYDITITPTASNSKIMLFTQTATQMSSQGRGYYTISKSGDSSNNGNLAGADGMANAENIAQHGNSFISFMHIDQVNSTNAITYKLQFRTSTGTLYVGTAGSTNVFYAYEIDGGIF